MTLLTDELRGRIGEQATYTAPEPLSRASIRYYALAVGDENPLYTDDDFARRHGHDGVIAPPTLVCDTNQYADLPMDANGYAGHLWGLEVADTELLRGGNAYEFHRPAGPETVVTATWTLEDIAERTAGNGAPMLVVTSTAEYTDQHGRRLATNTETVIYLGRAGG